MKVLDKYQALPPLQKRVVNLVLLGVFFFLQVYVYGLINDWAHTVFGRYTMNWFGDETQIPLVPWMIIPYFPVFYAFLGLTLIYFAFVKYDAFFPIVVALILIELVAFAFFIFMPVYMIRPELEPGDDVLRNFVWFYYSLDEPYNCFPSLHAALVTALAFWWTKNAEKFGKFVAWPVAVLVMVSTVFVKQHWIFDEIGGFVLALALCKLVEIVDRKRPKSPGTQAGKQPRRRDEGHAPRGPREAPATTKTPGAKPAPAIAKPTGKAAGTTPGTQNEAD